MKLPTLCREDANKVYSLLVEHVGARESARAGFCSDAEGGCREWRFCGSLGFGGKFWNNHAWYVGCYKEDQTQERLAAIKLVNEKLAELYSAFSKAA